MTSGQALQWRLLPASHRSPFVPHIFEVRLHRRAAFDR